MTEEIIIDGVKVAGCKHYDFENNYCDQSYLGEGGLLKNTKNPKRCGCSPNCYYKQLKRLEQENKDLKKQIESQKGLITVGGKQQYKYLQEIDKLKQENERLRKELDVAYIKDPAARKEATTLYGKPVQYWLDKKDACDGANILIKGYSNLTHKYKSALEEIRILATKNVSVESFVKIQNKINEVLNS